MTGYRTHFAGRLDPKEEGKVVTLAGWASAVRDHGGLMFVDLRDATGEAQVVFDPQAAAAEHARAKKLSAEDVIRISGTVRRRPEGTENPALASGAIEVRASMLEVLNECAPLPFSLEEKTEASEEVRLRYRYLDLRRPGGLRGLKLRHDVTLAIRNFMSGRGFMEVETPLLWKSTPEGARDYLVPSRLHPGHFFALPQSPQLIKQTLMVGGADRYFQVARCFRDEDLRADRQPEFTQVDVEMSFPTEDELMILAEDMLEAAFATAGQAFPRPVRRIRFEEAMAKYGTDKPDLRVGMEIGDATGGFSGTAVELIRKAAAEGAKVKALALPAKAGGLSRSVLEGLDAWSRTAGASGLTWFQAGGTSASPLVKRMAEPEKQALVRAAQAKDGDWVFAAFDRSPAVEEFMGVLRLHLARTFNLVGSGWAVAWVHDFPLFTWNRDEKRWDSTHLPFAAPVAEDIPLLDSAEGFMNARSHTYDCVINGMEILGGSIRIHDPALQRKVFRDIGLADDVVEERFGFLIQALGHGAPPHGGWACGLDRLIMVLGGYASIRDVIAFPKTARASCPLSGAPGAVSAAQLKELHLKVAEEEKKGS